MISRTRCAPRPSEREKPSLGGSSLAIFSRARRLLTPQSALGCRGGTRAAAVATVPRKTAETRILPQRALRKCRGTLAFCSASPGDRPGKLVYNSAGASPQV
eukprot:scaffold1878_cov258-Pinguiococcus_pyrenoidosus.AAC.25